ncbi:hypothetical protein GB864_15800 [Agromyces sp. MMS17-SY077]|uniref:Glycosyltransferase RgtA/B/C/D-like domain-containing protein n=2 Tax=Agromyces seonyuensis TaxID=2662446 RepID=A0A6I4P0X7_9MICO|nr:hypothetical protein [Agromyces seonyuensis]
MAVLGVLLAATSNAYGYHRDELYYRMLEPAWGYVDQPPLTPLLAHWLAGIVDEPWMLRIPAMLAGVATVLVVALIAREAGGGRRAQTLAAWAAAGAGFPLVFGHAFLSSSIDLLVWPLVALAAMRAVLRSRPRWWLVVGAVAGLASSNKLLVALLLVGIGLGLLLFGPRRELRSPWLWAGVGIALLLALPNVLYQATNEWPQLRMGAALEADGGGEARILMWPFLLLMIGPLLVPVWIAGLVAPFRRPELRGIRFVAVVFAVMLVFTFAGGAQPHYPVGSLVILLGVGCVPTEAWMRTRPRAAFVWAAVALNGIVSACIALPLVPATVLGTTPIPAVNQVAADSVGWPAYVAQIAAAVEDAPDDVVVVTANYGEAGAVARYGPDFGIDDAVYSGHNELWFAARPPDDATSAVFVGGIGPIIRGSFETCTEVDRLDDGVDVDNEEQGLPITVCTGMTTTWAELWPKLAHLS